MKFLLDTHSFLWFIMGSSKLSKKARALIEDTDNEKLLSVASLWEMAIKASLGKLSFTEPFEILIPQQLKLNGIELLNINIEHAATVTTLPFHHRDPFDRLLIVQCMVEHLPLLSADTIFDGVGGGRLRDLSLSRLGGKLGDKMKIKIMLLCYSILVLTGCAVMNIDKSIAAHNTVSSQVQLGDKKDKVLSILLPTQKDLPKSASKRPDQYIKDGVKVESYYMRSARQPDGLTTDDEFTPYIFNDSVLVGIGWATIGGPKTQGQAAPTTNVNVQQKTIVY